MASSLLEQVHGRGNGLKEFVRWKWLVVAIMLAASGHGMILSRGGFCVRGKPGGECLRLPSGRALVSYFSVACPPLMWSVTDYRIILPPSRQRRHGKHSIASSPFSSVVAEINTSIHTG